MPVCDQYYLIILSRYYVSNIKCLGRLVDLDKVEQCYAATFDSGPDPMSKNLAFVYATLIFFLLIGFWQIF